jgi:chromosome partitioning protein
MDPQGNASVGLGVNSEELDSTIYDVLLGEASAQDAIVSTESGVDVMTANGDLAGAQVELLNEIGRELRLKKALAPVQENYDYIFIDCPPALNVLTINALVASNSVMIPMQCEYFALEGLSALISTIRAIRETLNPALKVEGLLRTMFDKRNSLSGEVSRQLQTHFGKKVYETVVPRNVRLAEAPSYGEPAITYAPNSKGAKAYMNLADEMLKLADSKMATAG